MIVDIHRDTKQQMDEHSELLAKLEATFEQLGNLRRQASDMFGTVLEQSKALRGQGVDTRPYSRQHDRLYRQWRDLAEEHWPPIQREKVELAPINANWKKLAADCPNVILGLRAAATSHFQALADGADRDWRPARKLSAREKGQERGDLDDLFALLLPAIADDEDLQCIQDPAGVSALLQGIVRRGVRSYMQRIWPCLECGAREGELHDRGCWQERCPFCGRQLVACDCDNEHLGLIDRERYTKDTNFIPPEIYANGLTDELIARWDGILDRKGRIHHIWYGNVCAKCGENDIRFFHVPKEVWDRYIRHDERDEVICPTCFEHIRRSIDSGQQAPPVDRW